MPLCNRTPNLLYLASVAALLAQGVPADDERVVRVDDVVVTASRTPYDEDATPRSVTIIRRDEIAAAPVGTVIELLEYALGVDVRQRGPSGVQADVSIRGGTFEQTLVLIDGVKVNDPQTGHHLLDIPFARDDVERIEVVRGGGSGVHGPNAFGGAINIITRKGSGRRLGLRLSGGQHRYGSAAVSLAHEIGPTRHRLSVSSTRSDGHRSGAEFDVLNAGYASTLVLPLAVVDISGGFSDKEFGAYRFYSDAYPDEWEHTRTGFASIRGTIGGERASVTPVFSWRRHTDDFVLDRARRNWYRNKHTTDSYGTELHSSVRWQFGTTAVGGEAGRERIASSNLGDHERDRGGAYAEHRFGCANTYVASVGAFAYRYSGIGWQLWPGADARVWITDRVSVHGSVGRAFRVPTFTDLYYDSPANVGNPALETERAWSYEGGVRYVASAFRADVATFHRASRNLIDWSRADESERWQATNIASLNMTGVEVSAEVVPSAIWPSVPIARARLGYSYLTWDGVSSESKYALDLLRHQVVVGVMHSLPLGASASWVARWEDRAGDDAHVVVDARLSRRFGSLAAFVSATNLLGTSYADSGTIPAPGRWVRAGLEYTLADD